MLVAPPSFRASHVIMLIHVAPTFRGVKNNYALLLKDRDDKQRFDHEKAGVLGCQFVPTFRKYSSILGNKKPVILSLYPSSRSFFLGTRRGHLIQFYIVFDYGAAFAL